MVKRVFGRVDGIEVVLERVDGNRWGVPVPLDQDGEYAVEIIAEDEAGNQSYLARMMFCVDSSMLCARIVPLPYCASLLDDAYNASLLPGVYSCEVIEACCGRGV